MDEQLVIGLENYTITKIIACVEQHITSLKEDLILEDLYFSIHSIMPFGSRIFGKPRKNSDLDIRIEYSGAAREDDLCSALNDKKYSLNIEDIIVDFFPVKIFKA